MSIAKVIEVIAEGNTIQNAVEAAAEDAAKTVRNVRHVNVDNIQAIVEDGRVIKYRVNAKVTFVLD
jgi:flavin-binding protein dodecin